MVLQCCRLPPEGTTGRKPNLGEDLPGSLNSYYPTRSFLTPNMM